MPITAAGEHDDPATPIDSPVRRILRRPSERYRRERPRQLRYRLAVGIAEVISRIVAWLPDRVRDGIADRAGDIWVRLTPVYRANVIANLTQVLGPKTPQAELEAKARRIFRMSARNFGELLRLKHLTPDQLIALVPISVKDLAVLHDAHERGQGVIVATAHMGAFDLPGARHCRAGGAHDRDHGADHLPLRVRRRHPPQALASGHDGRAGTRWRPPRHPRAAPGRDRRVRRRLRFFSERAADDLFRSRDDLTAGRDPHCPGHRGAGRTDVSTAWPTRPRA